MTFEPCTHAGLIKMMIRRAWDRPEMLRDGADPENVPELPGAQYFLAINGAFPMALFIGFETAPDTLDIHACMLPECRGAFAIAALAGFLEYLKESPYRKITGKIPGYNKPMIQVALRAGFQRGGVIQQSVLRNGKFEDEILMERRLA